MLEPIGARPSASDTMAIVLAVNCPAQAPAVSATHNGVVAKGGQAPAFDVETGSVKVGTKQTTVNVPGLEVQKPGQNQAIPATSNAQ